VQSCRSAQNPERRGNGNGNTGYISFSKPTNICESTTSSVESTYQRAPPASVSLYNHTWRPPESFCQTTLPPGLLQLRCGETPADGGGLDEFRQDQLAFDFSDEESHLSRSQDCLPRCTCGYLTPCPCLYSTYGLYDHGSHAPFSCADVPFDEGVSHPEICPIMGRLTKCTGAGRSFFATETADCVASIPQPGT
jgi:hypothetical protein